MRAVRFEGGPEMAVADVPWPDPGPDDVVVRVSACGLCGSDVHFLEGMPTLAGLPMTLGHEASGVIETVGSAVTDWVPGDRVAVAIGEGCGSCRTCRAGWPEACRSLVAPGLHIDGAFAEYMRTPASTLVRVPDGVSMAAAAVATDSVASPYHALKCRAKVQPGEQVVVVGIGGLGSVAVRLAKLLGADQVVAVDTSEAALERATRNGADVVVRVPAGAEATAASGQVLAATQGGAEVVIECVGHPDTVALGVMSLVPGGRLVVVGVGMAPPAIPLPQAVFALWELSVIGSFASHRRDLEEVLAMAAAGDLDIEATISHRVDLEGVNEGYHQLREHRDNPQRIVMDIT